MTSFSTIAFFIMNAVNQRGKRGVGWEATPNQGESPHSLTFVMYAFDLPPLSNSVDY